MPASTSIMTDNNRIAAVREYIAGAGRALDRGDVVSASRELALALQYCFAIVREASDTDPGHYRQSWEDVAKELAKLPPSLVRQAMRIIDGAK